MSKLHRQDSDASDTERADEELYLGRWLIDELEKEFQEPMGYSRY